MDPGPALTPGPTGPVSSMNRSARVDFPWSMCAMMEKFLMFFMESFIMAEFPEKVPRPALLGSD
jgi:hypothetical protein